MLNRKFGLFAGGSAAILAAVALLASAALGGSAPKPGGNGEGTPKFTTDGGTTGFRTANTIKYWTSAFTDPTNGGTYSYTMVGTPPSQKVTTTVQTVIIPMSFRFSGKAQVSAGLICDPGGTAGTCVAQAVTMDPRNDPNNGNPGHPDDVQNVLESPVFTAANFPLSGDNGVQYGDAIQRSEFNVVGSAYHLNLQNTKVFPTVTIDVPANQGAAVVNRRGVLVGRVDSHWFSSQLGSLLGSLHIDAKTLPIFQNANVFLYDGNDQVNGCCVMGYHGATTSSRGNGAQQAQTFMFAAYVAPGSFGGYPDVPIADIHGLSHEVSEWANDPFVNNLVQPWVVDAAGPYGCTAYLETGDPVVGVGFPVAMPNGITYHPEDEVFLSWFARESPSTAQAGRYTYMDTFTVANGLAPAHHC